jgi:hypothetical protein
MNKLTWVGHRTEPRHVKHLPLRVEGIDVEGLFFVEIVFTENVSSSGACIMLKRNVPVGERLQVFINNGQIQNQAIGYARWVKDENGRWRVGLKFAHIPKSWEQ